MTKVIAPSPEITELLKALGIEGLRARNVTISIKPNEVVTATIEIFVDKSTIEILTKYAWKEPEKELNHDG